jgi:hypothetical protein
MRLNFIPKAVYGRPLYYPADTQSKAIALLAGRLTLNKAQIQQLQAGGFTINLEIDPATRA